MKNKLSASYIEKINNDKNGNPRYMVHAMWFLSNPDLYEPYKFKYCLIRAEELIGYVSKYKGLQNHIVFSTYNLDAALEEINKYRNKE